LLESSPLLGSFLWGALCSFLVPKFHFVSIVLMTFKTAVARIKTFG
jgi:hypothetical protein